LTPAVDVQEEPAPPKSKRCPCCGENYDEAKDPYHLDACRDARKP
jgi:transposase